MVQQTSYLLNIYFFTAIGIFLLESIAHGSAILPGALVRYIYLIYKYSFLDFLSNILSHIFIRIFFFGLSFEYSFATFSSNILSQNFFQIFLHIPTRENREFTQYSTDPCHFHFSTESVSLQKFIVDKIEGRRKCSKEPFRQMKGKYVSKQSRIIHFV